MATDPLVGRTLGPYQIERRLGGGGMAIVYQGSHKSLGLARAIKVMSSTLAIHDSFVRLFYREARLAASLSHPNIVQIFDVAQQDGLHYLVMELLEGRPLLQVTRRDAPIPLSRVVHLVGQLAEAVDLGEPADRAPATSPLFGVGWVSPSAAEPAGVAAGSRPPAAPDERQARTEVRVAGAASDPPAAARWRWPVSLAALLLLAALIGLAGLPTASLFSPSAETSSVADSRRESGRAQVEATATAIPPPATEPPPPPTTAPTAVPTSAPTSPPVARIPEPRRLAEWEIDAIIAQALALIQDEQHPNADLAVEVLDRLYRELAPDSTKWPEIEDLMIRALFDESRRRIDAAFVLKGEDEGRESRTLLSDAAQRLDRAARVRPDDASLRDRANADREQVDLTGWWVEFDVAYKANQNDIQIVALTRIVERRPDYRTVEGPAKEKLYAAWIAKAEESWVARQYDQARAALDEAARIEPRHPRAGELRTDWFAPRPAPVRAVQRPVGGVTASALAAEPAPQAPPSEPVPAPPPPPRMSVDVANQGTVNQGSVDQTGSAKSD